jgi:molybdate transport system substrate-binding protein
MASVAFAMVALTGTARSAELRVDSSNAVTEVLAVLGPQFEKATGNTLAVHYDTARALRERIMDGEAFDVAILTAPAMDDLVRASKVDPATRAEVARSGVGVAYKVGAPAPDIHDAASFKSAMLAARSVAYTTGGASGLYFMSVCEKLGIAEQVMAKSKALPSGRVAALVARGEAELAAQQISELLPVAGISIRAVSPRSADVRRVSGGRCLDEQTAASSSRIDFKYLEWRRTQGRLRSDKNGALSLRPRHSVVKQPSELVRPTRNARRPKDHNVIELPVLRALDRHDRNAASPMVSVCVVNRGLSFQ